MFLTTFNQELFSNEIPAKTHVLARAVIIHNNHILCAYDPKIAQEGKALFYHLPGCHLAYNEYAQTALVNQLKQRLNVSVTVEHCIGVFERSWDGEPKSITCHKHEVTLVFKAKLTNQTNELPELISNKPESVAFCWVALTDIGTLDVRPHVLPEMLPIWIKNSDSILASQMHIQ